MRTIQSEFPDYDDFELSIPPFVCQPWHNDACPKYVWNGGGDLEGCTLTLWVDYKDPEKRQVRSGPRYRFVVEDKRDDTVLCEFTGKSWAELCSLLRHSSPADGAGKPPALPGHLMHYVGVSTFQKTQGAVKMRKFKVTMEMDVYSASKSSATQTMEDTYGAKVISVKHIDPMEELLEAAVLLRSQMPDYSNLGGPVHDAILTIDRIVKEHTK